MLLKRLVSAEVAPMKEVVVPLLNERLEFTIVVVCLNMEKGS